MKQGVNGAKSLLLITPTPSIMKERKETMELE